MIVGSETRLISNSWHCYLVILWSEAAVHLVSFSYLSCRCKLFAAPGGGLSPELRAALDEYVNKYKVRASVGIDQGAHL
jgi:hypothetical protein